MRIRTIKPEFFEDEALAKLPPHARLLFIATWLLADRNGVLEYRPEFIQSRAFPYETGKQSDVSQLLPLLIDGGFLMLFEEKSRSYLFVPTFAKHQRISGKEAKSGGRYPLPPCNLDQEKQVGSAGEASGKHPGAQEHGNTGTREHGNTAEIEAGFAVFWNHYPKKVGKQDAYRAWRKQRPPIDAVLLALRSAVESRQWVKDGGQYIPHPSTWLNGRRWEDESAVGNGGSDGHYVPRG